MTNSTSDSTLLQQGLSSSELSETTWQRHFNSGKCTVIPITPNKRKPCSALDIPQPPWAESRNHKLSQLLIGVTINKYLTCPFHSRQREQSSWLLAAKLPDLHPWGSSSYQQNNRYSCHRVCVNSLGHAQPERHSSIKKTATQAAQSYLTDPKWENLEQQILCNQLTMLYMINNNTADVNRQRFHKQGDPRTRGAQRL